jgi:hypothetical protein
MSNLFSAPTVMSNLFSAPTVMSNLFSAPLEGRSVQLLSELSLHTPNTINFHYALF